jgi:hypothetical protein
MAWRLAESLVRLRGQVNAKAPNRSKLSDGSIGDEKHASRSSDHNPWVKDGRTGVVTAIDITHDPVAGVDAGAIAEALVASKDPRIKYVIWNKRIASSTTSPWRWRKYTGANPHDKHVHVSVVDEKFLYDADRDWRLPSIVPNLNLRSLPTRPLLQRGDEGVRVIGLQKILGVTADGIFGPVTEKAVKAFQKKAKLVADGKVGAYTWEALTAPSGSGQKKEV